MEIIKDKVGLKIERSDNMEKIDVYVDWCDRNFAATFGNNVPGAVVFTAHTWDEVRQEAKSTLEFHIEGMLKDGDEVADWLRNGEYEFVFHPVSTAELLRSSESYTTMAALAKASGVNQRQLSHYANGLKQPRPQQRQRIVAGLHKIGKQLMDVE